MHLVFPPGLWLLYKTTQALCLACQRYIHSQFFLHISAHMNDLAHCDNQAFIPHVLKAYMKTLSAVFVIGIPCSALALVGALIMDTAKMDMSHGAPSDAAAKKPADIEQGSTTEAGDDEPEDKEKSADAPSLDARHEPSSPVAKGTSAADIEKAHP
jgi:hypothetical protein